MDAMTTATAVREGGYAKVIKGDKSANCAAVSTAVPSGNCEQWQSRGGKVTK